MKTRVLVTGANGQLGQTLKELYSSDSTIDFTFTTKTILDITNKYQVDTFLSQNSFDYCINCAAFTNVEQAEKTPDPAFLVNAEAVKNIAEACKKNNIILIHISTDYVFDGLKNDPYLETDQTNPQSIYGQTKWEGEEAVRNHKKHIILRTSWVFGSHGQNFLKTILKLIQEKTSLNIVSDQKGTPTSVDVLADVTETVVKSIVIKSNLIFILEKLFY